MESEHENQGSEEKPKLRHLIGSVLSAAVGIQSSKNRERDFRHGKLSAYVFAGVIFVGLFIFFVYSIVHLVLAQANH